MLTSGNKISYNKKILATVNEFCNATSLTHKTEKISPKSV